MLLESSINGFIVCDYIKWNKVILLTGFVVSNSECFSLFKQIINK